MTSTFLLLHLTLLAVPTLQITLPTLPPNFTLPTNLPNLPPVDDVLPLVVLRVPGYGTIRGGTSYSWYTQRPYTFFRGVYYAKATTNETRFLVRSLSDREETLPNVFQTEWFVLLFFILFAQPPEPIDPYPEDEVQDVWGINPKCAQREGIEDCLTVNIFTPKVLFFTLQKRSFNRTIKICFSIATQ